MRVIAYDSETWAIRPGCLAPRLVCGSFYDPDTDESAVLSRADTLARLRRELSDPQCMIVGHNIAFDVAVACEADTALIDPWFAAVSDGRVSDTMLRQRLADLAAGHLGFHPRTGRGIRYSLAYLVSLYFDTDISESKDDPNAWRTRYHELDGVPIAEWPAEAHDYARDDAIWTARVWLRQGTPQLRNESAQVRGALALHLASCTGLRVDGDRLAQLIAHLAERARVPDDAMRAARIMRPNGSIDQRKLHERIALAYNGNPPRNPPTDKMITAGKTEGNIKAGGMELVESGDPLLVEYGFAKRQKYYLHNVIPALQKGTRYPINNRYTLPLATGRTSSSNPNLQNIPRDGGFRECVIPPPGWLLIACDYAQLELCTLAQVLLDLFGGSRLAEALQQRLDCHCLLAAELVELSYNEVTKHSHPKERQFCKIGNYGYGGGMGAAAFMVQLRERVFKGDLPRSFAEYTIDDAEHLRETWFRAWPEMREYFRYINELVEAGGTLVQPRSGRIRGGASFCELANSHFQGLAGDGALHAAWAIATEQYTAPGSPLYGTRTCAFVHDEFVLMTPEETAPEAAERLSTVMIEAMQAYTPDIPIEADAALMRRWVKGAEPVRGADGRLIPTPERE